MGLFSRIRRRRCRNFAENKVFDELSDERVERFVVITRSFGNHYDITNYNMTSGDIASLLMVVCHRHPETREEFINAILDSANIKEQEL